MTPSSSQNRAFVFIDGENLVMRFQAALAAGRTANQAAIHEQDIFVWQRYTLRPIWSTYVTRVFYYTSVVGDDARLAAVKKQIRELPVVAHSSSTLPGTLFPVVFKKLRNRETSKAVDVQLVVDMLSHVYLGNLDHVYLLSGDGDFRPAVETATRAGKRVTVMSLSDGLSPALADAADEVINLDGFYLG